MSVVRLMGCRKGGDDEEEDLEEALVKAQR